MANRFASGQKSLAVCDVCGFTFKLRELRNVVTKGKDTNIKACRECWDPDHPQLRLGEFPVSDPQALRDPRPDNAEYAQSRAQTVPVRQLVSTGFVGQVKVIV